MEIRKKYRLLHWTPTQYIEVLDIGSKDFWGVTNFGNKKCYPKDYDWLPYEKETDWDWNLREIWGERKTGSEPCMFVKIADYIYVKIAEDGTCIHTYTATEIKEGYIPCFSQEGYRYKGE